MKPTKYGLSFGDNTHSVVFEISAPVPAAPGRGTAPMWMGHGSLHIAGATKAEAVKVAATALRKLADELEADGDDASAPTAPDALAMARAMAAGAGAPPMTDGDVATLAAKVAEARPPVACIECSKPAVAVRVAGERMDQVCADHY